MNLSSYFRFLVSVFNNEKDVLSLFNSQDIRNLMYVSKDIKRYTRKLRKLCMCNLIFKKWYNLTKLSGFPFPSYKNYYYTDPTSTKILCGNRDTYIPYIRSEVTYALYSKENKLVYKIPRYADLLRNIFIDKKYKDYIDNVKLVVGSIVFTIKVNHMCNYRSILSASSSRNVSTSTSKIEWCRIPFLINGSYIPLVGLFYDELYLEIVFFESFSEGIERDVSKGVRPTEPFKSKIPIRLDFTFLNLADREKMVNLSIDWKIKTNDTVTNVACGGGALFLK